MQGGVGEWGAVFEPGEAGLGVLRDPGASEAGRGGAGLSGPERSCVACRTHRPKRALLRIVRRPDGWVGPDPTGSAAGRGAYVCRRRSCATAAPRALGRALRVSLHRRDLDTLRNRIEQEIERG
ncbi:MAG TPA: YlxR family protein [Actinomycetota bacterium]|nr:YlxR family protein [Actinomycetota bacterium]